MTTGKRAAVANNREDTWAMIIAVTLMLGLPMTMLLVTFVSG